MVKRGSKIIAVALLACIMICSLSACATMPSGKYVNKNGLVEQSFTFEEDDKVKVSAFGIDIEGTYVIDDGYITITYSLLGFHYDWTKSFKLEGRSIFIDGVEFIQEK